MKKKILFSAGLLFFVFGLMVISVAAQNPTIPTRTPTPGPQTPTPIPPPNTAVPTSPSSGGNPTPENPQAATVTPTTGPQISTPVGGYLPTAVPCSTQPTILALNANFVNVRTGPDTRYPVMTGLLYQEVRPIVGRDAVAAWWLIQLANGQTGWVADEVVEVQGNTAVVPVVPAPPLDGATVTPGAPWQPTTPPLCVTPATAIPSPTATPTANDTVIVAPLESAANVAYPAATPEPTTQTSVLSVAVTPTATTTAISLPTSIAAVPQPTVPPTPPDSNVDTSETDYSGLLLVGAGLLLVAGTAVFLIKRRS